MNVKVDSLILGSLLLSGMVYAAPDSAPKDMVTIAADDANDPNANLNVTINRTSCEIQSSTTGRVDLDGHPILSRSVACNAKLWQGDAQSDYIKPIGIFAIVGTNVDSCVLPATIVVYLNSKDNNKVIATVNSTHDGNKQDSKVLNFLCKAAHDIQVQQK
jgi:hypothetical protein